MIPTGTIYGFTREGSSASANRSDLVDSTARTLNAARRRESEPAGRKRRAGHLIILTAENCGHGADARPNQERHQRANAVTPAGEIRTDKDKVMLRVSGAFASEESLKQLTLHIQDKFVPLIDIATSREAVDPPTPAFRVNGESAIGLRASHGSDRQYAGFRQSA